MLVRGRNAQLIVTCMILTINQYRYAGLLGWAMNEGDKDLPVDRDESERLRHVVRFLHSHHREATS